MRYQGSIITRLFTRVVGRVAAGFRPVSGCLDNPTPHPSVVAAVAGMGHFIGSIRFCAPLFNPLSDAAFYTPSRSI